MIEISQIIFQLLMFIFLTSFPINKFLFPDNSIIKNFNFFTSITINSLFLMFVLLLFSFFKISLVDLFYSLVFIYLILLLVIFFNKKKKINTKELPLVIFFFFSLVCIFLKTAYQLELGWDGFSWKEKTNFFFNGGYLFDINQFTRDYRDYPHLGTYIWAFFWKNSFLEYEYIGRLFFNYIYVVSLFAIITNFRNLNDIKKIFIFILLFFCTFDTNLGGYQEYLIFSILSIFAATLVRHYLDNNNFLFYMIFLLSGILLPWIKIEGTVYSLFLIVIFLVYEFQINKSKKIYLKYFLPLLIIFSLLIKSMVNIFLLEESLRFQINFSFLKSNLSLELILTRIYYILFYTVNSFFKYPLWLFNSLGLILSIYYFRQVKVLAIFLLFFVLNFLFIFAIYFTTSADIKWFLSASLDRLLLQTSGFYFVIFSLIYKKIKKI